MCAHSWLVAHFSPTGNTARIARGIVQGSGVSAREVDLSRPVNVTLVREDEILLVVMPVFGGRVPAIALERLAAIKGSGQKAVAVVVYGNRAYDDALLELRDAEAAHGFKVVAAGAFIAEHSMVRSIASGRPDRHDLVIASSFGTEVMGKISRGDLTEVQVPGDPGYKEKKSGGSPNHPAADGNCDLCGICAKSCPTGAISVEEPNETDSDKCINCLRCVAICPKGARSLPTAMLTAAEGMLKAVAAVPKQPEWYL